MDGSSAVAGTTEMPLQADRRIPVALNSYSLPVIYRTCYSFTDRAYLWLEAASESEVVVCLHAKTTDTDLDLLTGNFLNALIDFALRDSVSRETKAIRETIIRAALAEAVP